MNSLKILLSINHIVIIIIITGAGDRPLLQLVLAVWKGAGGEGQDWP